MPNRYTEQALRQSRSFGVRRIPLLRPLGWLARGWRDLRQQPLPGLAHGLLMACFGALLFGAAGGWRGRSAASCWWLRCWPLGSMQ
jgi:hypothetical protein